MLPHHLREGPPDLLAKLTGIKYQVAVLLAPPAVALIDRLARRPLRDGKIRPFLKERACRVALGAIGLQRFETEPGIGELPVRPQSPEPSIAQLKMPGSSRRSFSRR